MPAYDRTSFHPPAPLAQVHVRSFLSGKSVHDVKLLIDTGADVSLLPRESVSSRVETEEVGGTLIFADVITRPHEELAALLPGM